MALPKTLPLWPTPTQAAVAVAVDPPECTVAAQEKVAAAAAAASVW